jgi:hypothetical protein
MRPSLFSTVVRFVSQIHVDLPVIRIPGNLPIEVQAAQDFQANVQPKARCSNASGFGIPTTFFDERSCSSNVVHALQRSFRHHFVNVEDNSSCCANDGVAFKR